MSKEVQAAMWFCGWAIAFNLVGALFGAWPPIWCALDFMC